MGGKGQGRRDKGQGDETPSASTAVSRSNMPPPDVCGRASRSATRASERGLASSRKVALDDDFRIAATEFVPGQKVWFYPKAATMKRLEPPPADPRPASPTGPAETGNIGVHTSVPRFEATFVTYNEPTASGIVASAVIVLASAT